MMSGGKMPCTFPQSTRLQAALEVVWAKDARIGRHPQAFGFAMKMSNY